MEKYMISSGECSMVKSFSLTFLRLRLNLFPYIFSWQCFFFYKVKRCLKQKLQFSRIAILKKLRKFLEKLSNKIYDFRLSNLEILYKCQRGSLHGWMN